MYQPGYADDVTFGVCSSELSQKIKSEATAGESMLGKVKWFSNEKGYGFITDAQSVNRHFGVRDVIGADLPMEGATVEFDAVEGRKGPRAHSIRIISTPAIKAEHGRKNASKSSNDDRVTCGSCGKKMVPRLITNRGEIDRSVCPFCGSTCKDFGLPWFKIILFGGIALACFKAYEWVRGIFA